MTLPTVAIIADADDAKSAEFLKGKDGQRLIFKSQRDAEEWLAENGMTGVDYRTFDGTD